MRTYIWKEFLQKTLTEFTCDRCGKNLFEEESDSYDIDSKIKFDKHYNSYGDYWLVSSWEVDLCEECMSWLKELLKQNNVFVNERDSE